MTRDVQTIAIGAPAEDAWNRMRVSGVHHLVVTQGSRVTGIVSDRDLGGRNGSTVRLNRTVSDLMTADIVAIPPTTTLKKAANMMRGRSIGCLVVTRDGRPVGIVTTADLLELIGRGLDRQTAHTARPALSHRVPHRKSRAAATGVW